MNKGEILQYFDKCYGDKYKVYISSIKSEKDNYFFMVKDGKEKFLIVVAVPILANKFEGENLEEKIVDEKKLIIKKCYLKHLNLFLLREIFPHLNPSFCGLRASFGTGDRLGIATPAHLQAFKGKGIFPILAQQSVREMARTERNWQKVLDDTIWGCFEEGYEGQFGADADHVKKVKELKEAADCGFTMFTIDPSDFIRNDIERLSKQELEQLYNQISNIKEIENLYLNKKYKIGKQELIFDEESLKEIILTYSEALNHVVLRIFKRLQKGKIRFRNFCRRNSHCHFSFGSSIYCSGASKKRGRFAELSPSFLRGLAKGNRIYWRRKAICQGIFFTRSYR